MSGDTHDSTPTSDRARVLRGRADEETAREMRRIHESGELRHLYGQPLHLDDDPDWLATKVLQRAGFSHPLIERSRELEEPRAAADKVVERLRRQRARLAAAGPRISTQETASFNQCRSAALDEYRDKLLALNRAIRDYNLQAPEALHWNPISVDDAVARASRAIPPLETSTAKQPEAPRRRTLWPRHRRG